MRCASFLSAVFLLTGSADAADFSLRTERDGEAIEIVAVAQIEADLARAWAVLTDYEGYPRFIPDLTTSRVVARTGGELVLEQQGALRLWWWQVPLAVKLAVVESPPRLVRSRLLEGSVRALEGRYELEPAGAGVRLTYTGRIVPDAGQRSLLDQFAIRHSVSRQFGALVDQIELRARQPQASPAAAGGT